MNRVYSTLTILVMILLFGTGGFVAIEKSSFLDGLYMTVITITTVGFDEHVALSDAGRVFTIFLIFLGGGFVLYAFGIVTETIVEGGLRTVIRRKKMERELKNLQNHFIVCGFGRIGKVICKILTENHRPFLVIENKEEEIKLLEELGYLFLEGDASDDELLKKALIDKARGLIAVVSSDADNVYIILSAKGLRPDLFVLARTSGSEGAETKLLRAGADKVISPYYIGATRMAQMVVRPTVIDFIDLTVHAGELGLRLEELSVSDEAYIVDKSLHKSNIRQEFDLIVVAIKRNQGDMLFNPNMKTTILAGDTLVVLGEHENIKAFEKKLGGSGEKQ
jgi:voltage-gated potassium channel